MKLMHLAILVYVIVMSGDLLEASHYKPEELLIKYKTGTLPKIGESKLEKIGWVKIKVESGQGISSELAVLRANSNIINIEPNYYGEFLSIPNDPSFDNQWYLPNINAPEAWDISLGSGVVIGLIDSGVDLMHPDLTDNVLPGGWDFGDDDDDPSDELGHGTQVCGVIAALQNNYTGISGTAPESKILPLKISEEGTGYFTAATVAEAIIYAADYEVKIINLSLGWINEEPQILTDAIDYAVSKGILLVAAAGNDYGPPVWYPASHEDVVAVSATNQNNVNTSSSFGPELALVAPGNFMLTTARGGLYSYVSGTSFSAPMVSAVAALTSAMNTDLSGEQLKEYLIQTADDLGDEGKDDIYGYGKVNAYEAVHAVIYCEGNFDCDGDQDGSDAFTFKVDFGRSSYDHPCESSDPCNGDFECDGDVDGGDAFIFKEDFGRSSYNNPCPVCITEPWCVFE